MSSALFCVPAGTRVSNFLFPFYRHYGVVMENGLVMSCSARTGRAMEETFAVFAGGQKWRVEKPPSDMPWWVVVQRARYFSDRAYHPSDWNCETFVNVCFGLPPRSHQAELTIAAAGLGLIALAAARLSA